MVIWINGAFGAGKTTAAYELHRRLTPSFVYDPEQAGFFLRQNMPQACRTADFQDMALWRTFTYQMLRELHGTYEGTLIVPMTLVNPAYYEEIIQRLTDEGVPVAHCILCASRETILKRLRRRNLGMLGREAFAMEAIERCLAFFGSGVPGIRIETDRMTVNQIVDRIGEACALALSPDRRGAMARNMDRLQVAVRHIR